MKKQIPIAAALMLASGAAGAATIGPLTVSQNIVVLPSSGRVSVGFSASLSHADNVPGSCGVRLDYGDGSVADELLGHAGDDRVFHGHDFTKAGVFTATLTPAQVKNPAGAMRPACSGSATSATVTVKAASSGINLRDLRVIPNGPDGTSYIEDKPLSMEVQGDAPGNCGYRVTGENLVNHNTVKSKLFTTFGAHEAITFKGHTQYRVSVEGEKSGDIPACKGHLSQDISVKNSRIWIYNVTLYAHRDYTDGPHLMAYPSYSLSKGEPCDFEVTWTAKGPGGGGNQGTFKGSFGKAGPKYAGSWADTGGMTTLNADSVTITVKGVGPEACNGGTITRTLSNVPKINLIGPEVSVSQ